MPKTARTRSRSTAQTSTACPLDAEPPRPLHAMADHRLMERRTAVGPPHRRSTGVACLHPHAREGAAVLTFRHARTLAFRDRYRWRRSTRFARVALAHALIVPVAVIKRKRRRSRTRAGSAA